MLFGPELGDSVTSGAETKAAVSSEEIARRFVDARSARRSLPGFPGPIPQRLAESYRTQDVAIGLWPDAIAGWKVGKIPEPLQEGLGADRVAGPIFQRNVWRFHSDAVVLPVIAGGFAAVEAEYVLRIGADAPADKLSWTAAEAGALVEEMFAGVELAGSPLATINELGPTVVASDFGNNAGLVLGPALQGWREDVLAAPSCATFIDEEQVGEGGPGSIPGGPFESLAFLLGHCAQRGRPLRAGQLVSTGAATGIHDVAAGQAVRVAFGGGVEILCRAVGAASEA